ncbi:MAG: urate oxidase [Acidimicrobiia bacterium]|nr:urate oxidase [Acidimicrobiia bacterium]
MDNSWGKDGVRVSKIIRGEPNDEFFEATAHITLKGDVEAAYQDGDNSNVVPTDTMKNTVYAMAQDHLTADLESFARSLVEHFLAKSGVDEVSVELASTRWDRVGDQGFTGGHGERRTTRVASDGNSVRVEGGISGLVVLKTGASSFSGFPKDEYTTLPETDDRILATSVEATWIYDPTPSDTTATWSLVRTSLIDGFFDESSASIQHQGWQMATKVLEAVPEITEISFKLPNEHHLPFDLTPLGLEDKKIVFQPVNEPFGDIRFTVTR